MMPGARFFFYSTPKPFILPNGRAGRADYKQFSRKGRCSPHPPGRHFSSHSPGPTPMSVPGFLPWHE
jgi:hypothetical protein